MDELDRERARLNLARAEKLREKQPAVLKRKAEREAQRAAQCAADEDRRGEAAKRGR